MLGFRFDLKSVYELERDITRAEKCRNIIRKFEKDFFDAIKNKEYEEWLIGNCDKLQEEMEDCNFGRCSLQSMKELVNKISSNDNIESFPLISGLPHLFLIDISCHIEDVKKYLYETKRQVLQYIQKLKDKLENEKESSRKRNEEVEKKQDLKISAEDELNFLKNSIAFSVANLKLKQITKVKPWLTGIIDNLFVAKLLFSSKIEIETKNRIALFLLDDALELSFKNFILNVENKRLPDINSIESLHKMVKGLSNMSEVDWKIIEHFHKLRNDLYHEEGEKTITDSDYQSFHVKVLETIEKLFSINNTEFQNCLKI